MRDLKPVRWEFVSENQLKSGKEGHIFTCKSKFYISFLRSAVSKKEQSSVFAVINREIKSVAITTPHCIVMAFDQMNDG